MQLAGNHFSYALIDITRNKFIALCDYRFSLPVQQDELASLFSFEELPIEKNNIKKSIAVHTGKSALVPNALYKKEDAGKMLELTSPVSEEDQL